MTKRSLLWTIIIISLSAGGIAAQPYQGPDTLWTRINSLSGYDEFLTNSAILLADGGLMLSANYVTAGETDWGPCMARLDSNGSLLWIRVCHDSVTATENPTYMCQIGPNIFILAATLAQNNPWDVWDIWVAGCDSEGTIVWQQGIALNGLQWVRGICAGHDSSAVVAYKTIFSTNYWAGGASESGCQRQHRMVELLLRSFRRQF